MTKQETYYKLTSLREGLFSDIDNGTKLVRVVWIIITENTNVTFILTNCQNEYALERQKLVITCDQYLRTDTRTRKQRARILWRYGMIVCSYHVTYAFQSESALYSCLNVKELFARNRREIWSLSGSNEPTTT